MKEIKSFKGRTIDYSKPIKIYKNLHNGLFSIQQNGLVVSHVESFILKCASFKVSESGRQKVIKEKKKNVHAFICGYIESLNEYLECDAEKAISYNPYLLGYFYFKNDQSKVLLSKNDNVYGNIFEGLYLL